MTQVESRIEVRSGGVERTPATEEIKRLLTVQLGDEQGVVIARQRARQIAGLLGMDRLEQTRFTTAVSEIARNAYEYGRGGRVDFALRCAAPVSALQARVVDSGPGITHIDAVLDGRYISPSGLGVGIVGARRLCDRFEIDSAPGRGTTVVLEKNLPIRLPGTREPDVYRVARELAANRPDGVLDEVREQNQELLATLRELTERQTALETLNGELDDTNRGVIALHSQLEQTAEALRRASEMKTRFLSEMSHEFRTPLNSIIGLSRLLLDYADGPLTTEQEKQVGLIHQSAQQLIDIVNDLLDTAKIESGSVTVAPTDFAIDDLFRSLRGVFRPLVGAVSSSVELIFEDHAIAGANALLCTDEGKVTQILRNLISNALKFTERGTVRVSAAPDSSDAERVVFAVVDTGIGIAEDDQQRIFDDFAQIDGRIQRKVKGTGLGLPLCRKLASLLGGTVTVESAPGRGSTFRLTLPRTLPGADHDIPEENPHAWRAHPHA